jgi:universal stress protein A
MNTLHASTPADGRDTATMARPSSVSAQAPLDLVPLRISKILVPVDFSPHSCKALRYAMAMASQFGAEVILAHVVEQLVYPGDWLVPVLATTDFARESREKLSQRLTALTKGSEGRATHIIRVGRAWQEVVEIAREQSVDLIVIGTHGYTGLRHVLLGSVAEKVLRHAPCPVLTVRPDEREFV